MFSIDTLRKNTTHVVLRDEPAKNKGEYIIWSQHESEKSANSTVKKLGKNCALGHSCVVKKEDLYKYKMSE